MTRYKKIAEDLIGRIRSGRVPVGEVLPGELQLMDEFGASRHTIRDALRQLEELGLVERRRGVGTRVLARRPSRAYVHRVSAPTELMKYPRESRMQVAGTGFVVLNAAQAALTGCKAGSRWMRIRAVRRMPGRRPPICEVELYLRPKFAAVAPQVGRTRDLAYQLIERRYGVHVIEVGVEVMARPMPADAAVALGVAPGSPSMTVVRRYRDERGDLLCLSVSEHPGDRYTYAQTLKRAWDTENKGWTPA
ncbi:MAG: GntR family transcriptional regulator [Steroidobacteraceae bacterium]|nr:GntR family transcriptional regulator [Steroidobacteraceae bacterium]